MSQSTRMAIDFHAYHKSITDELYAVKDRVRNLVHHWLTDGEWKEAALRTVLRRHLPDSVLVGRGFVVGSNYSSTQVDLIVLKPPKPTLFRDGDLVIVTPDVPACLVSVKTKLSGEKAWYDALKELAEIGAKCKSSAGNKPWLGLFAYEEDTLQDRWILDALCRVHRETGIALNCVTSGKNTFVRYWPKGHIEPGDPDADRHRKYWRSYELNDLSPAYFIGNLIDAVCDVDRMESAYAWFAHPNGKRIYKQNEKPLDHCKHEIRTIDGSDVDGQRESTESA